MRMKKEEEGVEKALLEMHFPFLKRRFQRHQRPFIGIALVSMAFTAFATMFMSMGMLSKGHLSLLNKIRPFLGFILLVWRL